MTFSWADAVDECVALMRLSLEEDTVQLLDMGLPDDVVSLQRMVTTLWVSHCALIGSLRVPPWGLDGTPERRLRFLDEYVAPNMRRMATLQEHEDELERRGETP